MIAVLVGLLTIAATALAGQLICRHYWNLQSKAVTADNVIAAEKDAESLSRSTSTERHRDSASPQKTEPGQGSQGNRNLDVAVMDASVTSAGNVVKRSEGQHTVLTLYRHHPSDSIPFHAGNLFPGDCTTQTDLVQVSYQGTVAVRFYADIRDGYDKLAEVLKCRVAIQNGEELYDGLMRDMPSEVKYQLPQSSGQTADLPYEITVYLDTSVGNDYMDKELVADFRWWVEEDQSEENNNGTSNPAGPGSGSLIPPQTGDDSHIILWFLLAAGSLLGLILLLCKRKKEGKTHE